MSKMPSDNCSTSKPYVDDHVIISVGEEADGSQCHGGKRFGAHNEGNEDIAFYSPTHLLSRPNILLPNILHRQEGLHYDTIWA